MTEFSRDNFDNLIGMVEDCVAQACQEAFENGEPMSGETAWSSIWAFSCAKVLEFEGAFDDDVTVE